MLNSNRHHNYNFWHLLVSQVWKTATFHISSKISAKTIEKKCNLLAFIIICTTLPTRARWSMFLAPLPIPNSTTYINHTSCDCPVLWAKKKMYKKFRRPLVYRSVPYTYRYTFSWKMVNFVLKILYFKSVTDGLNVPLT